MGRACEWVLCVWVVLVGGCGLLAGLVGGWGPWIRIVNGRCVLMVCGPHICQRECLLWWLDASSFIDEFIWSNRYVEIVNVLPN